MTSVPGGILRDGSTDASQRSSPDVLAAVGIQARHYLLEPGDGPWDDVIRALSAALGNGETEDLLRAAEIRFRTSKPR